MKHLVAAVLLALAVTPGGFAAGKGPEINLVDNKLSIDAQTVSLGRLLRLLDLATGLQSPLFPDQRLNQQGTVGVAPAPSPFGTPSPFGAPQNNPNNFNNPFVAPTVFGVPGANQPRP